MLRRRFWFLLPVGMGGLAGLWAATVRLGWPAPVGPFPIAGQHGALMISGFLGTLIGLERAVALGQRWAYLPPVVCSLGLGLLVMGAPPLWSRGVLLMGAAGFLGLSLVIVRRHPAAHTATLAAGAGLWVVGNSLWWLGEPVARAMPWWIGFLVLTIAGERLELGRLLRPTPWVRAMFGAGVAVLGAGLALTLAWPAAGWGVTGLGWLWLGAWLMRHDLARRTVRQAGLPRFIALCLLAGYGWLMLGGGLWVWTALTLPAPPAAGLLYDALVHTLLVGFVFSMIFGHAPIILPTLAGRAVAYHPVLYAPVTALHLALVLRVAGDLTGQRAWQQWGGLVNVLMLPLFLGLMVWAVRRGSK